MTAGRKITQNKQDWNTPEKYAKAIEEFFDNNLNLDPCSNKDSIVCAKNKIILPIDGLNEEWNFETIYVNPPYGRDYERKTSIKNWIKKSFETFSKYGSEILMLIPVATNTSHWKEYIFGKAAICFLYDTRLVFRVNGNEKNKGSPMACAMIYYGNNKNKFEKVFGKFGYYYPNE
jgi:16S rRNA G966 N2-methylase RsmD